MQINNYHSHTFRCKHATGDAVDYVSVAMNGGAKVYGISDHAPIPDGRFPEVRMSLDELDSYEKAVFKVTITPKYDETKSPLDLRVVPWIDEMGN